MGGHEKRWLDEIVEANETFRGRVDIERLPTAGEPCPYAVVTCMGPRVNLAAVGVPPFEANRESQSQIKVIRTLGGMADKRSLVVGIHLAGFKEVSHAYEREVRENWPYNLYSMVHGENAEDVEQIVRKISKACMVSQYRVLFTEKELKKVPPTYIIE